jgi:hypothetical protein
MSHVCNLVPKALQRYVGGKIKRFYLKAPDIEKKV